MTQQQFDAYLEMTGNGISSDNGTVAYISNINGDVVAMFLRGETSYLETLDEPLIEEKDPLNPLTWDASQWKDGIIGFFFSVAVFALAYIVIYIFG